MRAPVAFLGEAQSAPECEDQFQDVVQLTADVLHGVAR
jgi:hypothetical protein